MFNIFSWENKGAEWAEKCEKVIKRQNFFAFSKPFPAIQFFSQKPKLDYNSSGKVQPASYKAFWLGKEEASGEL